MANWPAAAEVSESLEYRYCTVEPRWYDSLGSALLKASPVRENGKTFMGITHWTVKWDMASSTTANGSTTHALAFSLTCGTFTRWYLSSSPVTTPVASALSMHL